MYDTFHRFDTKVRDIWRQEFRLLKNNKIIDKNNIFDNDSPKLQKEITITDRTRHLTETI